MRVPELRGLIGAAAVAETAAHIASLQLPSGLIPWFEGHHADPWDHVEGAMALSLAGRFDEARAAFAWSAEHQGPDGSWPMETVGAEVRDASADTNQCAYIAVGVWHQWLLTGDRRFVDRMWPVVRAALDFVVGLQLPSGALSWVRHDDGSADEGALLTGSSCCVLSLRCGLALAELVGDPQPDWELAVARLAHAVARHPDGFLDKRRFSMDWYYPVLGGAVTGAHGARLIDERWDEFIVPGRGCRCVADRPWVTAAETFELVMALDALGDRGRAHDLLADAQFLRADGGGYWTGWVFPEAEHWPAEQASWTSAALVLAVDALSRTSPANGLFRGEGLPALLEVGECDEQCLVGAAEGRR
ncbi:MAG: prenyltransferase [Jatrophihabitans sp.]|uniref:prenyltransferase n=1 Tax=Jatrophihabitans sp. TaxID=1932789 RepID=UPI003F7D2667